MVMFIPGHESSIVCVTGKYPPSCVLLWARVIVSVLCYQVMEVINEEEKQFLKTLSRGKRLFERNVSQLQGAVIPGEREAS